MLSKAIEVLQLWACNIVGKKELNFYCWNRGRPKHAEYMSLDDGGSTRNLVLISELSAETATVLVVQA